MKSRWIVLLAAIAFALGGCIDFSASQCADGVTCPRGTVCHVGGGCVPEDQAASCAGKADGDNCSYPEVPDGVCTDGLCTAAGCGNGIVEDGEDCDEGDVLAGDGCSPICLSEVCGNGAEDLLQVGASLIPEECDDGNFLSLDGCESTCLASPGIWETRQIPVSSFMGGKAAYDAARGRVVMLLVLDDPEAGTLFGETWEWDGIAWTNVTPAISEIDESVLYTGTLVYVPSHQRVMLFSGGESRGAEAKHFEWNGTRWIDKGPSGALENEPGGFMAYDSARDRLVSFTQPSGFVEVGETWEWDGTTWANVSPAPPALSPPPAAHAIVYDAARGRSVLLADSNTGESETWEWDGATWSNRTDSPHPEEFGAAVYDATLGKTVVFDGLNRVTWHWDGDVWENVTPAASEDSPPLGFAPAIAYDSLRGQTVLYASFEERAEYDTWTWDGVVWKNATLSEPPAPAPRERHAMAYAPEQAQTVLFGGNTESGPAADTWLWNGAAWSEVTPVASPPARHSHAVAYDTGSNHLVLFGGGDSVTPARADTWEWDGASWSSRSPDTTPSPRIGHAMAYDAARDQVVMFGGQDRLVDPGFPEDPQFFGDTWVWDGNTWTEVLSSKISPSPRVGASLTYDPRGERVILHGGRDIADGMGQIMDPLLHDPGLSDTWAWDGAQWTEITAEMPVGPVHQAMAFDAALGRVVAVGSDTDTWEWDGAQWTRGASDGPSARFRHATTYDAARGRLVLFGGQKVDNELLGDTWMYSHRASGPEACHTGFDGDGDDLVGCEDPDCWALCTPLCPPGSTCDPDSPQCGDGVCNDSLESPRLCPSDCGMPTALCGDLHCDQGETSANCPGDC